MIWSDPIYEKWAKMIYYAFAKL